MCPRNVDVWGSTTKLDKPRKTMGGYARLRVANGFPASRRTLNQHDTGAVHNLVGRKPMRTDHTCPNCGATAMSVFFGIENVPVHSVLLLATREEALGFPTGDIALGFCDACGFIANTAFDPGLQKYSSRYEATQAYSPVFNKFSRRLALDLIERHKLFGKNIIEIGCGQGEFLTEICQLGDNRGIGFDPAYTAERSAADTSRVKVFADFYSEKYSAYQADFVCCKMTLEHISQTGEFVSMVRRIIDDRYDTVLFFQVPNMLRVLRDLAFWDIYYEHCSYFSPGSLAHLFRRNAFDVLDVRTDYDDQYLIIEARPAVNQAKVSDLSAEDTLEVTRQAVTFFSENIPAKLKTWQDTLRDLRLTNQRVMIWGGGSKGVAFLTALNIREQIEHVIDINPHKNGTYMAGTGQQIVMPAYLKDEQPDVVIVMNPIYRGEIQRSLDEMGLSARLVSV